MRPVRCSSYPPATSRQSPSGLSRTVSPETAASGTTTSGASAAKDSLGDVFEDSLTSPAGIGLQIVMLAALVVLLRVDWTRVLLHHTQGGGDVHAPQSPDHK